MKHLIVARGWFFLLCLLVGLGGTGCTSFSNAWRKGSSADHRNGGLEGLYAGSWQNGGAAGHAGKLRCIITKLDENRYEAYYQAKYKRVLSFSYKFPLQVKQTGSNYVFQGETDLGKLAGGKYRYEGRADGTNFFSSYDSTHATGTFEMVKAIK